MKIHYNLFLVNALHANNFIDYVLLRLRPRQIHQPDPFHRIAAFERFVDPPAALVALHEDIEPFLRLPLNVVAIRVQRAVKQHPG